MICTPHSTFRTPHLDALPILRPDARASGAVGAGGGAGVGGVRFVALVIGAGRDTPDLQRSVAPGRIRLVQQKVGPPVRPHFLLLYEKAISARWWKQKRMLQRRYPHNPTRARG